MKNAWLVLAVAMIIATGTASATVCVSGPAGNRCKAEHGDAMAMYMVGREAYLEGRETGDLSEAYSWARRSKEAGFRGGRMLLKVIHMSMGEGGHNDPVQAHRWLSEAIDGGDDFLLTWRRRLEARMTAEQLAEARRPAAD